MLRTATYCSTPQHTATHCNNLQTGSCIQNCNTLQLTAAHCSTLQPTATHCNKLQIRPCNEKIKKNIEGLSAATHCNTLHAAACYNTLQQMATHYRLECVFRRYESILRASKLQHNETHCSTLQHTAAHCNTMQNVPCTTDPIVY